MCHKCGIGLFSIILLINVCSNVQQDQLINGWINGCIIHMKVLGALDSPKGMTNH